MGGSEGTTERPMTRCSCCVRMRREEQEDGSKEEWEEEQAKEWEKENDKK